MKLSKLRLLEVLREHVNVGEIKAGYNYNAFTIRCKKDDVKVVAKALRDKRIQIEGAYNEYMLRNVAEYANRTDRFQLLDFVCIPLHFAVWVPIPFDTSLNVLADVIGEVCPGLPCRLPCWS